MLRRKRTISRLENAPTKTEATRLSAALLDQLGTTVKPGKLEVLDIDDTFRAAHGGQQLAFWNAHHDERGFALMHIYHVASGTPHGFVDESGRYSQQGPDDEGQIRRLRSGDGVTKYGARKLALYVEREIQRIITNKGRPVALPVLEEPGRQPPNVKASGPAQRPAWWPHRARSRIRRHAGAHQGGAGCGAKRSGRGRLVSPHKQRAKTTPVEE